MRCSKCINGMKTENGYYCDCYDDYDMDRKDVCPFFQVRK